MSFYSRYIINPETIINQIIESVEYFNEDILQYALTNYHNGNEDKVKLLIKHTEESRNALEKEYCRLHDYSLNFNNEFVLDDNKCYSTALKLLRKLRKGLCATKDIFNEFCPVKHDRVRRYQLYRVNRPNVFDSSRLSSKTAKCLDLFDLSSYIPIVRVLLTEMSAFFDVLVKSMQLCKRILNEEKAIRADSKKCLAIYNKFKEKVLKETKNIVDFLSDEMVESFKKNNPMASLRGRYGTEEGYAQAGFHNGAVRDAHNTVLIDAYDIKKNKGLSKYEQAVWDTDVDFVMKVRSVIDHFDELIPQYKTRAYLDAKYVYLFARWCNADSDLTGFCEYFSDIYNKRTRTCSSVKYSAVNEAKNKMAKKGTTDKEQDIFVALLQDLLDKINTKSKMIAVS